MKKIVFVILMVLSGNLLVSAQEKAVRFVFVDADCKPGFELMPQADLKHVITSIKLMEFDNASQVLFAEDEVKNEFINSIRETHPGSVNQFNGVYVYMLNSQEDAELKKKSLTDRYGAEGIEIIEIDF